jgi:hypothetical protein
VDWAKSCVGCRLTPEGEGKTRVLFYRNGWPEANEHWRVWCYCWAMYLRVLRRNVEHGESVPYENAWMCSNEKFKPELAPDEGLCDNRMLPLGLETRLT